MDRIVRKWYRYTPNHNVTILSFRPKYNLYIMYGHRKEHVTIFLFPNKQKIHCHR